MATLPPPPPENWLFDGALIGVQVAKGLDAASRAVAGCLWSCCSAGGARTPLPPGATTCESLPLP